MEIYLVGGAVRDKLLGKEPEDKDYLVVGGTPDYFLKKGFQQVGKDFPVFLDPIHKEEYSLARIERKIGHGYSGFECDFSEDVSLEDDLFRRDLTINAMARNLETGNLHDPYNGLEDIANKVLRHVSDKFKEDPLRVLRVARFHARYKSLGFKIAEETLELMKEMVRNGEVSSLVPERVLLEIQKAFKEDKPSVFFETLRECGALEVILPEVDALFGVPQPEKHHPEIDTGVHTMMVLDKAKEFSNGNFDIMFAALVHDLGKALTSPDVLPRHINHEIKGLEPVNDLCDRLRVPNYTKKLSLFNCEFHTLCHRSLEMSNPKILNLLIKSDAFRNEKLFLDFLIVCEADAKGRKNFENRDYIQSEFLRNVFFFVKHNTNFKNIADKIKLDIESGKIKKEQMKEQMNERKKQSFIKNISLARILFDKNFNDFKSEMDIKIKSFYELSFEEVFYLFKSLKIKDSDVILESVTEYNGELFETIKNCSKEFFDVTGHEFLNWGLSGEDIAFEIYKERSKILDKYQRKNERKNEKK